MNSKKQYLSSMPVISIIVPMYNNEKEIRQCIISVQKNTFKDWELIIIDDCSSDNSLETARSFGDDSRIRFLTNKINSGVDISRYTGINASRGKFLFFLDADDWIANDTLEILLTKIEEEKSDVAIGNFYRVMDRFGLIKIKWNYPENIKNKTSIDLPQLFDEFYISFFGVNFLPVQMCGKLYRVDSVRKAGLKPSGFKMGEDLIFNMLLHPYLMKISIIDKPLYYYRFGGMTNTSNPYFLHDIKKQYCLKKASIEKHNYFKALPYIKYELVNCFYSHLLNLHLLDGKGEEFIREFAISELQDPVYSDLSTENLSDRGKFLLTKNIDGIMKIHMVSYKNQLPRHRIKKIVQPLLKFL